MDGNEATATRSGFPRIIPCAPAPSNEGLINRELSWLSFNRRVLAEAWNETNPLLERVRFLSISASNLNEFYMVRVAGLKGQVRAGVKKPSADGLSPAEQLTAVRTDAAQLMREQADCWRALLQELSVAGIQVIDDLDGLGARDLKWLERHFMEEIFPTLTPIATDPTHPFPFIPNLGFCLVLTLEPPQEGHILRAVVPIPHLIDRFIRLPGRKIRFVRIETLIVRFVHHLFPDFRMVQSGTFRAIRDSEMEIDEEAEDLVRTFETALKIRRRGSVIRLTYNADLPEELRVLVMSELDVGPADAVEVDGLLGMADTRELIVDEKPSLLYPPFSPREPERVRDFGDDIFAAINDKDLILHHLYESFDAVVQFVHQAAADPKVIAIKQTLYRTSNDSPIIAALIEAAENGKSVTAIVELKARFDEEANIRWAQDLERAGAQVIYGFFDKKIHAKVNLVVRREGKGLKSYVHFGTGNYHPITAKIYTDLSLFSADPALCRDAARCLNFMTGYAKPEKMEKVSLAPLTLRKTLTGRVETEIANARAGKPAQIWAKMNSLVDPRIIELLYDASRAGVEIDLVVRGICCLRPGVRGMSENIRVTSIVGRFLEHSRIVCFANGHTLPSDQSVVYVSSADWMPRNLNRRIELMVPLENATVRRQVLDEIMLTNLRDRRNSWRLRADGCYEKIEGEGLSAHAYFMATPSLSGRGSAVKARKKSRKRAAGKKG